MGGDKMTLTDTSLDAYEALAPTLPHRESEVYNTIKRLGPIDNKHIGRAINLPINSITGRTNSLHNKGLIRIYDKHIYGVGRRVIRYVVNGGV